MSQKPVSKGTRDFSPSEVGKRIHFSTMNKVFGKYGFQPIETPSLNYRNFTWQIW